MVDFGNTAFEGSLGSDVALVEPVNDRSGETLAAGLSAGIDGMTQSVNLFAESRRSAKSGTGELPGGLAVGISEKMNLLADAREQGKISASEFYTRTRALQNEVMANAPEEAVNIQKFMNSLLTDSGLISNSLEDTPEEKARDAVLEEALKYGWAFDPGMDKNDAVKLYSANKIAMKQLEDVETKVKLLEADGKLITQPLKNDLTVATHNAIRTGLPWVQGKIDEGFRRLQSVSDPSERGLIIQDVTSQITGLVSQIDNMRSITGIDTSYTTSAYKSLLEDFTNVANGKMEMDQLKLNIERKKTQLDNMVYMEPELALAVTLDKLTGFTNPSVEALKTAGVSRILEGLKSSGGFNDTGNTKPPKVPDIVGTDQDTIDSLEAAKESFKGMINNPEKVDTETVTQANNLLTGMFKSVARHSTEGMPPAELTSFMAFIATPEVGKWLEEHATELPPDIQSAARQITQQNYQNVGIDLINERWATATETLVEQVPEISKEDAATAYGMNPSALSSVDLVDVIEPIWNGAGIEFKVVDNFKNNAILRNEAKKLTSEVAGPLNNMVRAEAHLQGRRDYEAVYNEVFAQRLWVAGEDKPGDVTDLAEKPATKPKPAKDTAKATNDYFDKLSNAENATGNPNAKNPNSSAQGIFQFTTGTWRQVVNSAEGKAAGLTIDGRGDKAQEDIAIQIFTKDNEAILESANIPITDENRYAAHFLGAADAVDVLQADDNASLNELLPLRVIRANSFLNGMTVADFKAWLDRKF